MKIRGIKNSGKDTIEQKSLARRMRPGGIYRLQAQGFDLAKVVERVAKIFEMKPEEILSPGKQPQRVMARGLVCYWGVKELGMQGTAVGKLLGMVQSSVSRAVARGERLTIDRQLSLVEGQIA
ncbi:MAG: hypothetical protein Q7J61_04615 [Deltaproteobacteria bacterium]|nr:hypothetical protein [Deltaproteobacteria bacterium]